MNLEEDFKNLSINDNKYTCNICNKSYSNYESLWKHNKMIVDKTTVLKKSNDAQIYSCIYCNKIYNPRHVRFSVELNNVIDYNKIIHEHEQECKIIFEDARLCKDIINKEENKVDIEDLEEEIKLINKCYFANKKSKNEISITELEEEIKLLEIKLTNKCSFANNE
jgi:hypothetical protein